MKNVLRIAIVIALLALAGCGTVKGFGGDLQDWSDAGKAAIVDYADNQ